MSTEYIDFNKPNMEHFNTCQHRSETEVSEVRRSCCSSWTETGFKCNLLQVFKLDPKTCEKCLKFEPKLTDSVSSGAV